MITIENKKKNIFARINDSQKPYWRLLWGVAIASWMAVIANILTRYELTTIGVFIAGIVVCVLVFMAIALMIPDDVLTKDSAGKAEENENPQPHGVDEVLDRFASSKDDPRGNGPRPN